MDGGWQSWLWSRQRSYAQFWTRLLTCPLCASSGDGPEQCSSWTRSLTCPLLGQGYAPRPVMRSSDKVLPVMCVQEMSRQISCSSWKVVDMPVIVQRQALLVLTCAWSRSWLGHSVEKHELLDKVLPDRCCTTTGPWGLTAHSSVPC